MKMLITGGAGFIGSNTANFYLEKGNEVIIFDNLSRKGTEKNLQWLLKKYENLKFIKGSIVNYEELREICANNKFDACFHFAAQVAVTTSVTDPRPDFMVNALGSFNILEALRETGQDCPIIYTSTNKVYGEMTDIKVRDTGKRYEYEDYDKGIPENYPLDFHSPYGCSKGSGDQYFIDYARIYGLKTVIFRQSCIYGQRQFGNEDQGWVAHFIISAIKDKPLTIYGNGKQIRDILHIDDLINLYDLWIKNIEKVSGQAFNIGGGSNNTISLLELISILETQLNKKIKYNFADWRPGDQKVYVSNIARIGDVLNWKPEINIKNGIEKLINWIQDNPTLFE
ncbi:GDP-mannose 4,6-dehydratase [Candidatus Dependentiae bacterium]|nr:GDP-mannose 4,6-dehydratase [Candidatus Dependentiae bacterium]